MELAVRSGTADAAVDPAARRVVSRRALFGRLRTARRVTEVSAPAGSGKTVLLRSWIAESGLAGRAAWVAVQPEERDLQRFWITVADALRATAAASALVRPLTAAPDLDGWEIVERLLKDLARLEDPVWLVVDDVHQLAAAEGLRQLELLVMRAPDRLRFVLVTRHDLRLGLHRLRLAGELTEIRADDLRFTLEEARALFDAAGVQVPDPTLALLHARAEGWAAGLRLAALSLAGHPDPVRFAEEFSGSERTVAEYLLAEVLERQPEGVRRLLLRTSVAERVCGELADLLTGSSGGERVLQDLERVGAFVVSLDARRSWFRYHQLFADLLQLELRRTAPGEIAGLHRAASDWFARHGYPVAAVRHAQAAGDWELAARLLADHWVDLELGGRAATARELLARFPAGVAAADAELIAMRAAGELTRGSLEEAEQRLTLAAQRSGTVPAERRGRFQVMLTVVRLWVARQRGNLPAVVAEAQQLLAEIEARDAQPTERDDLRALAMASLGAAERYSYQLDEAEQHLSEGAALARRTGRPYLEVDCLASRAVVAALCSSPPVGQLAGQAVELAGRNGWDSQPVLAAAYLALAARALMLGRLDEAEPWLECAERVMRAEIQPGDALLLYYERGLLELARGRNAEALAAVEPAVRFTELVVEHHLVAAKARAVLLHALVRLGETGQAEAVIAALDEEERRRGEMRSALAALRLALGDPDAATAVLAPVLDGSVAPAKSAFWMAQPFLLEAMARDALGDAAACAAALERALDIAEPGGDLLPFLVHPVPALLERHARQHTGHAALIADILSLLGGASKPAAPPAEPRSLREPLSPAETRVLRYLPTHLRVPEIAGQLSLSVNTVQTHLRHLYGKLGVHRRSEAVEQARALGLLAPSTRRPVT